MAPGVDSHSEIRAGLGFLTRLPRFLRRRLEPAGARAIVERRLRSREDDFLRLAREGIYGHGPSPYRALLREAGCAYGDLERLVRKDGLESALASLLRAGVYLKVDEYKGRSEVKRGSLRLAVAPEDLRHPLSSFHVPVRSSGSSGGATPVMIGLDFIFDCAVNAALTFETRGGWGWAKADWEVPGGGAVFRLLKLSRFGGPVERWFSHIDPAAAGLHPRYLWSARLIRWGGRAAGRPLPSLTHVPLEDARPILDWLTSVLGSGRVPCLFTFPSSAVSVCLQAEKSGRDIGGARFLIGGEPVTAARLDVIRRSGGRAIPRYGMIETGPLGYACLNPSRPDEVHLHSDMHALIRAGGESVRLNLPPDSLFLTSLRPSAPFLFLNVSPGDQGRLSERGCGCPLEGLGWTSHLHDIRSFEKLTGAGMTFMDADIVAVLESVLPKRFGGSPTDYQIVEEEDGEGRPVLRLVIRPEVGPLDEGRVVDAFLEAVGRGRGVERIMGLVWKESRLVRVERGAPRQAASGKILHFVRSRPRRV